MLILVRFVHTVVWAAFVACILGVFVAVRCERFDVALWLIGIVLVEVVVLLVNGMRCPLTGVAARYTDDRADNFDIWLPRWLARHNKTVFGLLYVLGIGYALVAWFGRTTS